MKGNPDAALPSPGAGGTPGHPGLALYIVADGQFGNVGRAEALPQCPERGETGKASTPVGIMYRETERGDALP